MASLSTLASPTAVAAATCMVTSTDNAASKHDHPATIDIVLIALLLAMLVVFGLLNAAVWYGLRKVTRLMELDAMHGPMSMIDMPALVDVSGAAAGAGSVPCQQCARAEAVRRALYHCNRA